MSEATHTYSETEGQPDSPLTYDRVIVLIGAFGIHGLDEGKLSLLPFAFDLESLHPNEVVIAPDENTDGRHIDFLFPSGSRLEEHTDRALDRVRSALGSVGLANAEPKAVFASHNTSRTVPAQEAWHQMDEFTDRIYDHEQQDSQLPTIPDVLNPHELF